MKIKPFVLVILILEILDIILTVLGVVYLGHRELNPMAVSMGLYPFLALKTVLFLTIAGLVQVTYNRIMRYKLFVYVNLVILIFPVIWNTAVILIAL
jgi:hypothetical protein